MAEHFDDKHAAIVEACKRHGVAKLEVFGHEGGQIADGQAAAATDFLVEFAPMDTLARVDAYFGLLDDLRLLTGREIDLIMTRTIKSRRARRTTEREKRLLYAA